MAVKKFLDRYLDPTRPFLLALSGGVDSLTLFHLLEGYQFAVAHVDHGWRSESTEEAKILKQLAAEKGIVFHLKTLKPETLRGNLEAACRQERQKFFRELCETHNYQAVMLAHHKDDQAEGLLKKVFEGAPLEKMQGMRQVSKIDEVVYWRPLLNHSKQYIRELSIQMGLTPFEDSTNSEERFMRANMRRNIIPYLSEIYGKEIVEPLIRVGNESAELESYLAKNLQNIHIEEGALGWYIFIPEECHFLEKKYLFRKICAQAGGYPSSHTIDAACRMLSKGDKRIEFGRFVIYIDRCRVFIPRKRLVFITEKQVVEPGVKRLGSWKVIVTQSNEKKDERGWKHVWHGEFNITLPRGDFFLGPPQAAQYYGGGNLDKWWTNAKVPAFLRHTTPVIWGQEGVVEEFLTGRPTHTCADPYYHIKFEWINT